MYEKLENKERSSTIDNILNCAKSEFLEKGFKDASLRNIAKQARVTTGAIYGYFKDKDDLFVKIVKEFVDELYNLIEKNESHDNEIIFNESIDIKTRIYMTKESHIKYIEYLYSNIDICKLILLCSSGSSMENCIDDIMEKTQKENLQLIKELKKTSNIDEFTIHILVEFYFRAITEFIKHDIPYDIALKQMNNINSFFFAGWSELIYKK